MSTYLWIHIIVITFPLLLSFDKKVHFYTQWKFLFPAISIAAFVYISWDIWFTRTGIWGFNSEHLHGISFFHLPMEEILFFITVPYASVFIYEVLKCYFPVLLLTTKVLRTFSFILQMLLILIAILHYNHQYTIVNFIFSALVLFVVTISLDRLFGTFFIAYLVVVIPFVLVNGILTGMAHETPVVWYNTEEIIGTRILTIPIEDFVYNLSLMGLNVYLYERFKRMKALRTKDLV